MPIHPSTLFHPRPARSSSCRPEAVYARPA